MTRGKCCARCPNRARQWGRGPGDEAGKDHEGEAGVQTPDEGRASQARVGGLWLGGLAPAPHCPAPATSPPTLLCFCSHPFRACSQPEHLPRTHFLRVPPPGPAQRLPHQHPPRAFALLFPAQNVPPQTSPWPPAPLNASHLPATCPSPCLALRPSPASIHPRVL